MASNVNIVNFKDVKDNDYKLNASDYCDKRKFKVIRNNGMNCIYDNINESVLVSMVGGFDALCDICDVLNTSYYTALYCTEQYEEVSELHTELFDLLCKISQSMQYGIDNERSYGDEYTAEVLNDIYEEFNLKEFKREGV